VASGALVYLQGSLLSAHKGQMLSFESFGGKFLARVMAVVENSESVTRRALTSEKRRVA
jgi:hypothetical protein